MNERMTVIDGNSLLYRAFYAIPRLNAPDGMPTNALYGFLNTYLRIMNEFDPEYVVVALDVHAPTFRHKFFEAYKGTRKPTPEELIEQSKIFAQLLETAGICVCTCEGFEADDILGKWSAECDKKGVECLLITGDRDSLQLITDNTNVILVKNLPGGGAEFVRYDKTKLFEKYSLTPTEFIDLKALMGDSSDNIPGVAGIGEVTAQKLLVQYRTLEGVYENIDSIGGKLHEKLEAGKQSAFDSRYLATIVRDFPMETDWEKAKRTTPTTEARALFTRLGFYSLIEKFGIKADEEKTRKEMLSFDKEELLRLADLVDELMLGDAVCVVGPAEQIDSCMDVLKTKIEL
jgi:DNA polymerase-1